MDTKNNINKMANISKEKKIFLILLSSFTLAVLHIGVFFIDNSWWWLLLMIVPLLIVTFKVYKDEIFRSILLKSRVSYTFGWVTFDTFLLILISAIFITPLWWIGLILVFIMMAGLGSFMMESNGIILTFIEKRRIVISTLMWFLMMFLLYCVPSFSANSDRNPKEGFGAQWSPVESYSIYGLGIRDTEHIIAQSWYDSNEHYVNDYINTIWSNKVANNARGNLPFGNVKKNSENAVYDNDTIVGYKNDKYFMPSDEYKGDVARIMLYMYVTYQDDDLKKKHIDVRLMKKWSKHDPVDDREKERNNTIYTHHQYSNKFVDRPRLVRFIV